MQRDTTRDASDLNRPEGNDLVSNYEVHDTGEAHIRQHLRHHGLVPIQWGIDKRHDDDGLIFDDGMDLKVYTPKRSDTSYESEVDSEVYTHPSSDQSPVTEDEPETDELCALTEIKTKTSESWFGVINRRHLRKYLHHSHHYDVPAFIYMALVDDSGEQDSIIRDTFIPLQQWEEYQDVLDGEYPFYEPEGADQFLRDEVSRHPQVERTFRAPDGNQVVKLDLETGIDWPEYTGRICLSDY